MRGRPPKPTALKILAGNPGKRPLNADEPEPLGDAVKPAWLAEGKSKLKRRASAVWDELAPERIAMGILKSDGAEQFAELCCEIALYRWNPGLFPAARLGHMRSVMNLFGFNPSARAKLHVPKAKPDNPFAKLG